MLEEVKKRLNQNLRTFIFQRFVSATRSRASSRRRTPRPTSTTLMSSWSSRWKQDRQNRVDRYLRESKLPLEKSWEAFDRRDCRGRSTYSSTHCSRLVRRPAREPPRVRQSGQREDSPAVCYRTRAHHRGHRVLFTTCSLLVQELLMAKRELRLARLLKRLAKFRPLILDDIGYVQQDREEMEVLFTLLAERYERGSIILTSNLPFSKWEKIFKDPMTTAAAIDRLVHTASSWSSTLRAIDSSNRRRTRRERPRRQKTGKRNDPPQESTKRPRESPQETPFRLGPYPRYPLLHHLGGPGASINTLLLSDGGRRVGNREF